MSSATLPTGPSDARYSTTAAVAEVEASNATLSTQVQQNANQLHAAATNAARTAEFKEPQAAFAVDQLEQGLSQKTNAAASEGAYDVESAKASATGYVEHAKNIAGNVFTTAQSYASGIPPATNGAAAGIGATVQSALQTGKEYLASAQAAAQPYIETAAGTAHATIEKAKGAVSTPTQTGSSVSGKPSDVPASTASLESGPHVVDTPYSAGESKVGEL
ncbi:hypothetical protein BD309DRAFT_996518 [Dichomitus squalens]|nr:hypothetical protein BD309DRAFT_996518 [Dichomitus squalens]